MVILSAFANARQASGHFRQTLRAWIWRYVLAWGVAVAIYFGGLLAGAWSDSVSTVLDWALVIGVPDFKMLRRECHAARRLKRWRSGRA